MRLHGLYENGNEVAGNIRVEMLPRLGGARSTVSTSAYPIYSALLLITTYYIYTSSATNRVL